MNPFFASFLRLALALLLVLPAIVLVVDLRGAGLLERIRQDADEGGVIEGCMRQSNWHDDLVRRRKGAQSYYNLAPCLVVCIIRCASGDFVEQVRLRCSNREFRIRNTAGQAGETRWQIAGQAPTEQQLFGVGE